ncbi:threonine dehydrogenase-like Zn-dependent dehydrogenase [Staphylococcus cohnii]
MQLTNTGVKLTSTITYTPTTFQQTIDLINEGNLKVKDVITDEIELDDIVELGFEKLINDKSQAKILIKL